MTADLKLKAELHPPEKALVKLLSVLENLAMVVIEPLQRRRLARSEWETKLIDVEGQRKVKQLKAKYAEEDAVARRLAAQTEVVEGQLVEEPIPLIRRAERRLELQNLQRQVNLEAVVTGAAQELTDAGDDEISDIPVEDVWATRLFEYAQDVSDPELRSIWSKVLAREIKSPAGSLRALDILRSINREEARMFEAIARCATTRGIVPLSDSLHWQSASDYPGKLTFDEMMHLSEAGLVNPQFPSLQNHWDARNGVVDIDFGDVLMRIDCPRDRLTLSVVALSRAGTQIAQALQLETSMDHLTNIAERLCHSSRSVAIHRVSARKGDGPTIEEVPFMKFPSAPGVLEVADNVVVGRTDLPEPTEN